MLNKRILVLMFVVAFLFVGCLPTPVNQTPILTSDPITTATVGVLYTYNVNATDPDDDALTYSLIIKPSGMIINSVTGVIFWTPVATQIGDNSVTVKVSDGSLSITQPFIIKVSKPTPTPINHAPVIYSPPIITATVGVTYVYDVNATDQDGDTLIYSLTTYPTGMTISSTNGVIIWIPTLAQVGINSVIVKVSDGALSDTQSFTITVSKPTPTPINQKPVINSYPITTAIVGETYTYTIYAFDPDGDILTYSVIDVKPIGMTINSANGFIWWIPTSTQIGDNLITVMVFDGALSDTQSFIVKVSEPEPEPEPEPGLTEITVLPDEMDLIVGGFDTFEVTAHYDNETTKIVTFKCRYGTSNSSIAYVAYGIDKVTTLTVGTATIFISYTQHNFLTGEEITKTAEIEVTVNPEPSSYSTNEGKACWRYPLNITQTPPGWNSLEVDVSYADGKATFVITPPVAFNLEASTSWGMNDNFWLQFDTDNDGVEDFQVGYMTQEPGDTWPEHTTEHWFTKSNGSWYQLIPEDWIVSETNLEVFTVSIPVSYLGGSGSDYGFSVGVVKYVDMNNWDDSWGIIPWDEPTCGLWSNLALIFVPLPSEGWETVPRPAM